MVLLATISAIVSTIYREQKRTFKRVKVNRTSARIPHGVSIAFRRELVPFGDDPYHKEFQWKLGFDVNINEFNKLIPWHHLEVPAGDGSGVVLGIFWIHQTERLCQNRLFFKWFHLETLV